MVKLNYFYRVDKNNFPVPGSLQRFAHKPQSGNWKLLEYNNTCCAPIINFDMDVFLIAGQSNAKGRATDTPTPSVGDKPIYQVNNGVLSLANDPVGVGIYQSVFYSAWPQFGLTYNQLTGKRITFVPSGVSGASLLAAADIGYGNWSPTGAYYAASLVKIEDTINTLKNLGYNPIFKGILWLQGETDAEGIQNTLITQADYITALQALIANYRAIYGAEMRFHIIRVGTRVGYPDAGYASIRAAQEIVANADPYTKIIYYGTVGFPERGLMNDVYHYKAAGYNEIGRLGAFETVNF